MERRGSAAEPWKELHGAVQKAGERIDSQGHRLDGIEKLMEGTQQVISFIGEVVKGSRLVELLFKQAGNKANKKVRGPTILRNKITSLTSITSCIIKNNIVRGLIALWS